MSAFRIWGAHAPRRNALRKKKCAMAGRHRQHARRVRSPEHIAASIALAEHPLKTSRAALENPR
ncbi:MAG: hypothetical protein DMF15_02760 [Verrucomicrobia bacterium]|nr:MAG: hypothetical protein DMF15_02760 [Verrucomicrobiota bacterium]